MKKTLLNNYDAFHRKSNVHIKTDDAFIIYSEPDNTPNKYGEHLIKINEAINKLDYVDRQILHKRYVEDRSNNNITIFLEISVSESTFYRRLNRALNHFEDVYNK